MASQQQRWVHTGSLGLGRMSGPLYFPCTWPSLRLEGTPHPRGLKAEFSCGWGFGQVTWLVTP